MAKKQIDEEEIRKITNEEMDKRVKPKKAETRGDPQVKIY